MKNIANYQKQIVKLCEELPVKRLGLFGSVLNENFTAGSDIDVLVSFSKRADIDLFSNYFELKEKLEGIFHRTVDLVIDKNFKNPYFRQSVEKTRKMIYER